MESLLWACLEDRKAVAHFKHLSPKNIATFAIRVAFNAALLEIHVPMERMMAAEVEEKLWELAEELIAHVTKRKR